LKEVLELGDDDSFLFDFENVDVDLMSKLDDLFLVLNNLFVTVYHDLSQGIHFFIES
jgi:hypothetical protein